MVRKARRDSVTSAILAAYDQELPLYSAFTTAMRELIAQLLVANGIGVHSVTCRIKARNSLEGKLARPSAHYNHITDVTDLCGIRITTYFEDTVDRIAALIEQEFEVDRENSIDKRALLDPDRFGYLSLHHVVTLRSPRSHLAEYRRYAGYKAEIQTRSILQHAWAEIEHDLGYKSNLAVPAEVRRRFARLAGLLELADKEFTGIRDELDAYQAFVATEIREDPARVGIDKASLNVFVRSDSIAKRLDREIVAICGAQLDESDLDFLEDDPPHLLKLGIKTIDELSRLLSSQAPLILEFARVLLTRNPHRVLNSGISLFYLWYVQIASIGDRDLLISELDARNIGGDEGIGEIANDVLAMYREALARVSRVTESGSNGNGHDRINIPASEA